MEFQPSNPEITREEFDVAFADFRLLPSHLQSAQTSPLEYPTDIVEKYEAAVDAVRDSFYERESTSEDFTKELDLSFLVNCFGSSDGSETRMMLLGLKPAVFISDCHTTDDYHTYFGGVPTETFSGDRTVRDGLMGPNYGFTAGTVTTADSPEMHGGFIYNVAAVERVAQNNADLFKKLGYDPSEDGATFAKNVLISPNRLAHSVLLGYSPMSAVCFYLQNPDSLGSWMEMLRGAEQDKIYVDEFNRSLTALLTPKQLAIANQLMGDASTIAALGAQENQTTYQDYWKPSLHNQAAQQHLQTSGFSACLQKWTKALGLVVDASGKPHYL